MSVDSIARCERNLEAAFLSQSDCEQARRVTLLWQRPLLSDAEVVEALGIPPSLWAALKSEGDTPPLFLIGRRLFCRVEDLRAWIDARAAQGRPGSRRRRNAPQQRSTHETTD